MTGQVSDTVRWQRQEYELVGIDGGPLFEPTEHRLEPEMESTACYRGFVCHYGLRTVGLFLNRLEVYLPHVEDRPPEVHGVQAQPPIEPWGMWEYTGVNLRIPFRGRLLLGRDFDWSQYQHMGFQDWQAYRDVREAVIDGRSVTVTAQARDEIPPPPEIGDTVEWIDRRFTRDRGRRGWP